MAANGDRASPVGRFILDHSLAAWVIWLLALFVVNSALASVVDLDSPRRFGFMAWLTVFELVAMPLTIRGFARRQGGASTALFIALAWSLAQAPLRISYGAMFDKAPQWLVATASIEALAVMTYSLRMVRRGGRIQSGGRVEQ